MILDKQQQVRAPQQPWWEGWDVPLRIYEDRGKAEATTNCTLNQPIPAFCWGKRRNPPRIPGCLFQAGGDTGLKGAGEPL